MSKKKTKTRLYLAPKVTIDAELENFAELISDKIRSVNELLEIAEKKNIKVIINMLPIIKPTEACKLHLMKVAYIKKK